MARPQVRNSVLYSDDVGKTWHVSPGTMLPDREKAQWEPTLIEQPGGEVRMIARNTLDSHPTTVQILTESIVTATSRDGGETWSALETVPVESVSQRPNVSRIDFDQHQPPGHNSRFFALHADNRQVLGSGNARDRHPLSLYFKRGSSFEFEAGTSFTGDEVVTHYPQMWREGNKLLVSYTRGVGLSGIKVAHIEPLPDPDRYYIFPRARSIPDSPCPKVTGQALRFFPHQSVVSKAVAKLGEEGFSAVAWLGCDIHGNILDTSDATKSHGFNWAIINGRASFQAAGRGRVQPDHEHMRYASWSLLGVTVDIKNHDVSSGATRAQR